MKPPSDFTNIHGKSRAVGTGIVIIVNNNIGRIGIHNKNVNNQAWGVYTVVYTQHDSGLVETKKKDKYRRKGKGRPFCLWDRNYSIPSSWCDLSYSSNRPSASRNLIISVPQKAATTFAFSSVFILLLLAGRSDPR